MSPPPASISNVDRDSIRKSGMLFTALSDDELDGILALAKFVNFPARKMIIQEGEPGDFMLVILDGRAKVSLISIDGKEAILSLLGNGEAVGEMSLLDGDRRSANVTALQACRCLVISRLDFLPFLERHPRVALKMLEALSRKIRATNELVGSLSFKNLPGRLARILINLSERYGQANAQGMRINFRLSQEDLGNLAGVSRESVNRQLHAWEDEGILQLEHGAVTILKQDVLIREALAS